MQHDIRATVSDNTTLLHKSLKMRRSWYLFGRTIVGTSRNLRSIPANRRFAQRANELRARSQSLRKCRVAEMRSVFDWRASNPQSRCHLISWLKNHRHSSGPSELRSASGSAARLRSVAHAEIFEGEFAFAVTQRAATAKASQLLVMRKQEPRRARARIRLCSSDTQIWLPLRS